MCCCSTKNLPRRSNAKLPPKHRQIVASCNHPCKTSSPSKSRIQQRKEAAAAATSSARKYIQVQNLPARTNPKDFLRFINEAMIRQQAHFGYCLCKAPAQNCIVADSSAYLTLQSPDVAHHALALNGIEYFGRNLCFGILLGPHDNCTTKSNIEASTKGDLENCCGAMALLKVSSNDLQKKTSNNRIVIKE